MKLLAVASTLVLWGTAAAAQSASPFRAHVSVDGAWQGAADDFHDSAVFTEHAEEGRFTADYTVRGGPAPNISGGATLWKQLGIGVGVSRFSRSTPAVLSALVPHPFVFDRDREVTGDIGGLRREEIAVHVRATGVFPIGTRTQVLAFAGPSFFHVRQGVVTDFTFTEQYPYDTAAFAGSEMRDVTESTVGANVGVDVGFFLTPQIGIGGMVQFAGATLHVPSAGGRTLEAKTGGFQAGGGLRLRFWR